MYFVHPQIKFNWENLSGLLLSFFKEPEKELKKIKSMFPQKELVFCDMGRTAFRLIIEELNLQNSKMMVPAYLCDIFYPIFKRYNISPLFLDVEKESFQVSLKEIKNKINPEIKSILVCHTYGLPVDIKKIREITNNQALIIEDCAHSFGAKLENEYLGNFGDAAFFSLYKQFPIVRGGLAILKKQKHLKRTGFDLRDFVSLLNNFSLFAFFFKKFGNEIAPKVQRKEKSEDLNRINNFSFNFFLLSQREFEKNLKNRIELALFFQEELRKLNFETQKAKGNIFCYLSALTPKNINRDEFLKKMRKNKVFATRIWRQPIILNPEVQKEYQINPQSFPNALEVSQRIINFPLQNYYTKKEVEKITSIIKNNLIS